MAKESLYTTTTFIALCEPAVVSFFWTSFHVYKIFDVMTHVQGERQDDEESSEDEWSDAEDTDTPIDSINPFIVYADTIKQLQQSATPRFQVQ